PVPSTPQSHYGTINFSEPLISCFKCMGSVHKEENEGDKYDQNSVYLCINQSIETELAILPEQSSIQVFSFVYDYETCQLLAAPIYFREDMVIEEPADGVNFPCGKTLTETMDISIDHGCGRVTDSDIARASAQAQTIL
ncbi:hypothetical protein STEG23_027219, partial [Scotinomys teguina]